MKKLLFILLIIPFAAKAQFIPDVPNISINPADTTINVFAPSTQAWSPLGKLQVKASSVNAKIQLYQNSSGNAAVAPNMAGLEMFAGAMNNSTNSYTPAIKFGSNDSDFGVPTGRMRFLAGLVGIATESYTATTSGGMGIDLLVSNNAPGTASTPTVATQFRFSGVTFIPLIKAPNITLTGLSAGAGGTDSILTKTTSNIVGKIGGNFYTTLSASGTMSNKTLAANTTIFQGTTGTTNDSLRFASSQKMVDKAIVAGSGVTITQTASTITFANSSSRSAVNVTANATMALNTDYQNISTTQYVLTLPPCTSFAVNGSQLITVDATNTGGAKISVPNGYALNGSGGATLTDGTGYITISAHQKVQLVPSTTTANTYEYNAFNGTVGVH